MIHSNSRHIFTLYFHWKSKSQSHHCYTRWYCISKYPWKSPLFLLILKYIELWQRQCINIPNETVPLYKILLVNFPIKHRYCHVLSLNIPPFVCKYVILYTTMLGMRNVILQRNTAISDDKVTKTVIMFLTISFAVGPTSSL